MARKLRRYKFSGLPRLTRAQVDTQNALLSFLPSTIFENGFKEKLREALEPIVRADLDFWLDDVRVIEQADLSRTFARPSCIAVLGLEPRPQKILVETDLTISQRAIDRMLGGNADDTDAQRSLSDIEAGVFSFLVLKVLSLLQHEEADPRQLSLRLDGLYGALDEARERLPQEQRWVVLPFKLFFDIAVGYCRVLIPESLIQSDVAAPTPSSGPARDRQLRSLASRIGRVATLRRDLVVEVGRISLAVSDLDGLEEEDIILVEGGDLSLQGGGLGGVAQARIGDGRHGLLQGDLTIGEEGRYEFAISSLLAIEEPGANGEIHGADNYEESDMNQEHSHKQRALAAVALPSSLQNAAANARQALAQRALCGAGTSRPNNLHQGDEDALNLEHSDDYEGGYEDQGDEAPTPEAAGMLDDVTVSMVVELGRVNVSAADILGLRAGQIIELTRSPGDPVDLVVDGKRVGQGELVEIEGELGVRILSLVK